MRYDYKLIANTLLVYFGTFIALIGSHVRFCLLVVKAPSFYVLWVERFPDHIICPSTFLYVGIKYSALLLRLLPSLGPTPDTTIMMAGKFATSI